MNGINIVPVRFWLWFFACARRNDQRQENDNENTVESVFEVQYTDQEGAGFDCLQCQ